ncbi:MAG: extracellular solute-binding protein, partial [Exilispira sp.]|nr:extracellular solute-binding protein [Exilispira sp.]
GVAMHYRKDLFDHPEEKENFLTKYGYELKVPETYDQFRDVAEFFTRKAGEKLAGKTLTADFYGTSHSNKPTAFLWYDFVNYLMAFGADNIYDPETLKPTFNSPEAIAAGKYYVSLVPFLPPGHMTMSSGESTAMFAEGSVAMIIEYFQRVIDMGFNPEKSKVFDKIDFGLCPSVQGIEGREHAAHFGGNCISLYGLSANKEAAYKTIELAFSAPIIKKVFLEKYTPYGWIPPRPSVLEDPESIAAVPLMKNITKRLLDPENVYYFEMPTLPEYYASIDICGAALSSALAGETDVETAFNKAQEELEELFYQAGYIQ